MLYQLKAELKLNQKLQKKKWTIAKCKCKTMSNSKRAEKILNLRLNENGLIRMLPMEGVGVNQIHLKSYCSIVIASRENWREGTIMSANSAPSPHPPPIPTV